ncbi:RAMP superfamily CRISPR-associated protein [Dyadobacter jejuensis]|nr:RAMP superfamily CRISPR-associated protein [Dyadobacter jejuensis]
MIKPDDSTITQNFQVEIITPTHIGGAGENHWRKDIDFVIRDSRIWILDFVKLSKDVTPEKLSRVLVNGNSMSPLLDGKKLEPLTIKSFPSTAGPSNDIRRHTCGGFDGRPYIPGSSLKGSVSSILLKYFSKLNHISGNSSIVKNTLGDFENSVMRFFQFTDVHFEDTFLTSTKIFNLHKNNDQIWEGGWKHGINKTNLVFNSSGFTTMYESLIVGSKGGLTVSFKKKSIEQLYLGSRRNTQIKTPPSHTAPWLTSFSFTKFCKMINEHTLDFLGKEIKFFEKYTFDENTARLLEDLKEMRQKIKNLDTSKECILRMAAGSGFHSITGDWQYDKSDTAYFQNIGVWTDRDLKSKLCKRNDIGKQKYKSRKLAFEKDSNGQWKFLPMGFVKLTMVSLEDLLKAENERLAKEIFKKEEMIRLEAEAKAAAEALRLAESEAKKPNLFEGKLKVGAEIDAEIVVSGKPNIMKIFVNGQLEEQIPMIGYLSPEPVGKVAIVSVHRMGKDGKIKEVKYKKFK